MVDETQKKAALYSQTTLEAWILGIPTIVREKLIESNCGTTSGYVLKRLYTRNYTLAPTFKLKIAMGLDKASNGQLDFRDFVDGRDEIDWQYLWKALGKRLRAEAAAAKKGGAQTQP